MVFGIATPRSHGLRWAGLAGRTWPRSCDSSLSRMAAQCGPSIRGRCRMLHWALIFFVVALVAALLGFRGVAGLSAQFGYLFAILAVIMLVIYFVAGRGPVVVP